MRLSEGGGPWTRRHDEFSRFYVTQALTLPACSRNYSHESEPSRRSQVIFPLRAGLHVLGIGGLKMLRAEDPETSQRKCPILSRYSLGN